MTDITTAELIARFPELDEDTVDTYISGINASWPCIYGGSYGSSDCDDEVILNLAAHLFIIDSNTSSAPKKDVSGRSVGNISISYVQGDTNGNTLFFGTTKYGQRYLMLTAKNAVGGFFV